MADTGNTSNNETTDWSFTYLPRSEEWRRRSIEFYPPMTYVVPPDSVTAYIACQDGDDTIVIDIETEQVDCIVPIHDTMAFIRFVTGDIDEYAPAPSENDSLVVRRSGDILTVEYRLYDVLHVHLSVAWGSVQPMLDRVVTAMRQRMEEADDPWWASYRLAVAAAAAVVGLAAALALC
jgi:hypothetical protein